MKHSPIKRQTNIELLRIISIIMIIFHHFAVHGGFNWEATAITIPHFWYNFIVIGGKVGVNIFILISGYFLITKQDKLFDVKKF
ncbi:acyltransferase family protein [Aerococcus sanguinicola]|uniref:Acyltransferase family protein n=1 Tax=Aerococcus sanguinicola TaxID=119206 RepID=A0A5N1GQ86_9LACT|nr:acyltransferase family protein [Aerococcus sanguinicola]